MGYLRVACGLCADYLRVTCGFPADDFTITAVWGVGVGSRKPRSWNSEVSVIWETYPYRRAAWVSPGSRIVFWSPYFILVNY